MGNPEILPRLGCQPVPPPQMQVLWMVYRLREDGKRLAPQEVLCTGRTGVLELLPHDSTLTARLVDASGYPTLDSLHNARVIRHDKHRGLLLHGTVLSVKSGRTRELPQAWWCLVASAKPLDPAHRADTSSK